MTKSNSILLEFRSLGKIRLKRTVQLRTALVQYRYLPGNAYSLNLCWYDIDLKEKSPIKLICTGDIFACKWFKGDHPDRYLARIWKNENNSRMTVVSRVAKKRILDQTRDSEMFLRVECCHLNGSSHFTHSTNKKIEKSPISPITLELTSVWPNEGYIKWTV